MITGNANRGDEEGFERAPISSWLHRLPHYETPGTDKTSSLSDNNKQNFADDGD